MTNNRQFQPGERVPETAVYSVIHDGHRESHQVTLRNSEIFPRCTQCADRVRFELVTASTAAEEPQSKRKAE